MVKDNYIIAKYNNDWLYISCHRYLSEEFIEAYSDKVHWSYICFYQRLSVKFI